MISPVRGVILAFPVSFRILISLMPAPASAEDRPDVPPLLRAALEERWGEGRVLALALVDRDADWRPVERWLILTGTSLSLWMTSGDGAGWRCDVEVERSRIARIDRSELLAGNRWQLRSADGEMLLEINTRRW